MSSTQLYHFIDLNVLFSLMITVIKIMVLNLFILRFHILELIIGTYLLGCGSYDYIYGNDYLFVYIIPQAISFFVMGFGYIGTIIPSNSQKKYSRCQYPCTSFSRQLLVCSLLWPSIAIINLVYYQRIHQKVVILQII